MSRFSLPRVLGLVLTVLTSAAFATGQNIQNPQSAVDNLMRSNLHVDPATGAFQLQIPLGGPPGRGAATLPVVLQYSSKVWNIKYINTIQCSGEPVSAFRPEYAKSSASGWTSSVGWLLPQADISVETYDFVTNKPATQGNIRRIARKYVTLADGSRHELRRDDALHLVSEDLSGTYYAVDGSRLWMDAAGTLYLPDGSRVTSVGGQPQYVDRNGNFSSYDPNAGTWQDTLNRSVGVPVPGTAPAAAGDVSYTLPGGMTYILRWRTLGEVLTDPSQQLRFKGDAPTANCGSGGFQSNNLFSSVDAQEKVLQSGIHNPIVLYQIVLPHDAGNPNPLAYTFTYNIYGEIDKIVYPTGGTEQFTYDTWSALGGQLDNGTYSQANRGVVSRVINDGVVTQPWQYGNGAVFPGAGVDPLTAAKSVIAPDGTVTTTWYYKSRGTEIKYGFDDARAGMIREVRVYTAGGAMLRRTLYEVAQDGPQAGGYTTARRNARVTKQVDFILDTGGDALATATEMTYDADLNVTSTKQYDYVSINQTLAQTADIPAIPNGALLRTQETDYLTNDQNYRNRNLLSLPTANRVKDAAGNIVAQTSMAYDEAAYPPLAYGAVAGWSDPGTNARGNPTSSGVWLNTTGVYLQTHAQYDQHGSIRNTWDAKGNQSQIEYSSTYAYAYPTLARTAVPDPSGVYGSNAALVATMVYDFNTGLVTSTTDTNNQTTSFSYVDPNTAVIDPLRRIRTITKPDGGLTTYNYNDAPGSLSVQLLERQDATRNIETIQTFDALGRPSRSFLNVGGGNYNTTDTQYDLLGRVSRVSNPYVSSGPGSGINPSGKWTTNSYDALSRLKSMATADSAQTTTDYGASTSTPVATTVTVTDQAGKLRRSLTDALGRLVRVDEPNDSGSLGEVSSPNQATSYSYDVLGNLRLVVQGSQQRFYAYDSLSRLLRVRNPETAVNGNLPALTDPITGNSQWSIAYGYDNNGNLTQRTDPRGVVSTYAYDALNRNTSAAYANDPTSTPTVTRTYDGAINGKGRPTKTETSGPSGSRTTISSFDAMGRPTSQKQQFFANGVWSQSYSISATYDRAGHVIALTYPSGHTANYSYDVAGRTSSFTGNLGEGVTRTYANDYQYSVWGTVEQEKFGTETPLYHKQRFNDRGQVWDMRLSTVPFATDPANGDRGAIVNYYSANFLAGGSGADNNGNLRRQEIYVPGSNFFQQTFSYDSLNRLTSVAEKINGAGADTFKQAYAFDRWGNRTIDQNQTTSNVPRPLYTVDPNNNNRLLAPAGYTHEYDAAGNQTRDSFTTSSPTAGYRTFDAENRIIAAQKPVSGKVAWAYYTYDGDGQRVRRKIATFEIWQIYGFGGELLAEYPQLGSSLALAQPQKEYGYRNGQLLVTLEPFANLAWNQPATQTDTLEPSATAAKAVDGDVDGELETGHTAATNQHESSWWQVDLQSVQNISSLTVWGRTDCCPEMTSDFHVFVSDSPFTSTDLNETINQEGVSDYFHAGFAGPDGETGPASIEVNRTGRYVRVQLAGTESLALGELQVWSAAAKVEWVVMDHLNTPRIAVDKTGSLAGVSRHDYLPFGEDLSASTTLRSTAPGYSMADGLRQRFTSQERDGESGLDYFGARYAANTQGRFTGPDPYGPWAMAEDQKLSFKLVPQQWNRYSYCLNNPLRWIDPSGLEVYDPSVDPDTQARIHAALVAISEHGNKQQRIAAMFVLHSNVLIRVGGRDNRTTIPNPSAANARIDQRWISIAEAGSYVEINISPDVAHASTPAQIANLEATLVHEINHAYDHARTISSLSSDQRQAVWDPTRYKTEYDAYQQEALYLLNRGGTHQAVGLDTNGQANGYGNGLLKNENGKIKVNEQRIRDILAREPYRLNPGDQGGTTTKNYGLRPRS